MRTKLVSFALVLIFVLGLSPVAAQDGGPHRVSFDGFSFTLDAALAANVNIWQYPGDPVDLEQPGGPQAKHTLFTFYNERPVPESYYDGAGGIYLYKTADFAGYTFYEERLAQLQTLLAGRPDLASFMVTPDNASDNTLPFLPIFPAAQVIRARAAYVDTATVTGISYVTVFRQDAFPFFGNEFLYTFQGLSADGAYYVSAIFRLNTALFPMDTPADFDYEAFVQNMNTYFAESVATLNGAAPEAFAPSLTTLDALIQSFAFEG